MSFDIKVSKNYCKRWTCKHSKNINVIAYSIQSTLYFDKGNRPSLTKGRLHKLWESFTFWEEDNVWVNHALIEET